MISLKKHIEEAEVFPALRNRMLFKFTATLFDGTQIESLDRFSDHVIPDGNGGKEFWPAEQDARAHAYKIGEKSGYITSIGQAGTFYPHRGIKSVTWEKVDELDKHVE